MSTDNPIIEDDPIVLVYLRNEFYKKKFYALLAIFMLNLFAIGILAGMLTYLVKNPPHPLYFVADNVARLVKEIPVQDPNLSIEEVTAWAAEAVQLAYTYDYVNYRSQLQNAQKYFTDFGWRSYMNGLSKSNNLVALTKRSLIQIATIVQRPQLVVQGHMGTVYAYQFKVPVLMTYWYPPYDDKAKIFNPLLVTVTIQRRNLFESYKGLGVAQMNAELITSGALGS